MKNKFYNFKRRKKTNSFRMEKQDSREKELLEQIKFCLLCKNEAQAIRMLEQYKYYIQNKYENNN